MTIKVYSKLPEIKPRAINLIVVDIEYWATLKTLESGFFCVFFRDLGEVWFHSNKTIESVKLKWRRNKLESIIETSNLMCLTYVSLHTITHDCGYCGI